MSKFKFEKQFRLENPQTIGETDSHFDLSNYCDWLEEKLRWIPIEEKLPSMPCFLVAKKKTGMTLGLYFSADKEFRYGEIDQTSQITHWRLIL